MRGNIGAGTLRTIVLLGLLWGCEATAQIFADGFETAAVVANRIVVEPGATLFTTAGQSETLAVTVLDSQDQPVSAPVRFKSTNPDRVSVSSSGVITAAGLVGTAQIIVSTPDALDAMVFVTVAQPTAGALLLADEQVIAGPDPVDPDAVLAPGFRTAITATGIDLPAPGTIVVGTGALPIAGSVVSATAVAAGVELILELVPLPEVFADFAIDEQIDLSQVRLDLDPDFAELYDVERRVDGSLKLTLKPGAKGISTSALVDPITHCETNTPGLLNLLTVTVGSGLEISRDFSLEVVDGSSGVERFVLSGNATATYEFTTRLRAAFSGKITCERALGFVVIPVGGPLAAFINGQLELGIGLELGGAASLDEPVGYDVTVVAQGSFNAGLDCASECEPVADAEASADGTFRFFYPESLTALADTARLQANGSGFLYADFGVGALLGALSFKPLGISAGLRQSLDLQSASAQVGNSTYASDFKLELFFAAGATNDFQQLLSLLAINTPPLTLETTRILAQSPKGQLVISDPNGGRSNTPDNPARVEPGTDSSPGELATFDVTLNPTTYLGGYIVSEVQVLELVDDGEGGQALEFARPLCGLFEPTP
ncbi:MAG: hypothetical protein AAGA95_02300, partial [Pseudomonadota bacterium]